jgi:hypothetical protein
VLEPDVSEYETKYESHGIAMVFVKVVNSICSGTGRSKLGMILTKSNVMGGVLLIVTEVWWGCSMQLQLHMQQNLKMKSAHRFESFVPLF